MSNPITSIELLKNESQWLEKNVQGEIRVRILVSEQGEYIKHLVTFSCSALLEYFVEKHISKLKFTPAIQDGKPIKFWVNIPFRYKLR